ncbi:hypothetical protein Ciccas_010846 [Cichlidogyrus casuarinus]|uniref:Uncharacterized protein n=1 Tax=Cichlidogyrus casuarinus TaxID=1844966 RepID=A0ABD2PVV4_9PLAT
MFLGRSLPMPNELVIEEDESKSPEQQTLELVKKLRELKPIVSLKEELAILLLLMKITLTMNIMQASNFSRYIQLAKDPKLIEKGVSKLPPTAQTLRAYFHMAMSLYKGLDDASPFLSSASNRLKPNFNFLKYKRPLFLLYLQTRLCLP